MMAIKDQARDQGFVETLLGRKRQIPELRASNPALRGAGEARGEAFESVLRGEGPQPRSAALAGRLVRVLTELELAILDRQGPALRIVEPPARTALERSAAFRAYHQRLEDGLRYLTSDTIRQAA